jgi:hypothetical protein
MNVINTLTGNGIFKVHLAVTEYCRQIRERVEKTLMQLGDEIESTIAGFNGFNLGTSKGKKSSVLKSMQYEKLHEHFVYLTENPNHSETIKKLLKYRINKAKTSYVLASVVV